jgi:hypothetical protein
VQHQFPSQQHLLNTPTYILNHGTHPHPPTKRKSVFASYGSKNILPTRFRPGIYCNALIR